jgi:hypothetical protein
MLLLHLSALADLRHQWVTMVQDEGLAEDSGVHHGSQGFNK